MRIKRGTNKNKRHTKVLKLTKGYRQSYGRLYKRSIEALHHAGQYSMKHRRHRRSQLKSDWVKVINAALENEGVSYSKFVHSLKTAQVELNSKSLGELALAFPQDFAKLVASFK